MGEEIEGVVMGDGAGGESGDPPHSLPHKGGEGKVGSASADPEDPFLIAPGNNRKMQKRRAPRRKLFGKARKARFLEDFACTANVAASAAAAGVTPGCVFTHRRTDPEFAADYWVALEQAVGKLAALRVQREIERTEAAQGGQSASDCPLDGPPDEKQIVDLVKLMQMLRDLCRNLAGEAAPTPGRPQHASVDEVCSALAKRLKAFPPTRSAPADRSACGNGEGDSQQVTVPGGDGDGEG